MNRSTKLSIRNFAQIATADITFGDLTVLVGAQGTGKSLALQWLKTAMDGRQIVSALRDAGQDVNDPAEFIDLIFGVGMRPSWRGDSTVKLGQKVIRPENIPTLGGENERVYYVPAHRAMLISDGWAAPFQKVASDTPVVVRLFSQSLFELFKNRGGDDLFPYSPALAPEYRRLIDESVYHGGTLGLKADRNYTKRLKLTHGDSQLPFMTWTAGQREFTPLLLGLYQLFRDENPRKPTEIEWVVVEEPEMGLHPQAITAFLLLVLDLLARGYKVALSTHSPHVLTAIWMLRRLQHHHAEWPLVCKAFGVPESNALRNVAEVALTKDYKVHLLAFEDDGKVRTTDISALDPFADDERMSGWGGLTEFSSRFGDAVRAAVNASDE